MTRNIRKCSSPWITKRLIGLVAAITLLLGGLLTACNSPTQGENPTLRIGVALYRQDDTFISTIVSHLESIAQAMESEQGIKINLSVMDGRSNQTVQMEQIDSFLEKGLDIILVNIVDRTAAAVIVDKAQAADTPVVFFNRQPVAEDIARWDGAYYVGAQAESSGILQGELVYDAWNDPLLRLDKNGDGILQYIMLEGEEGHQDALLRTRHSIDTLIQSGIQVEKLDSDTANWNRGQAAGHMNTWINAYGEQIEVVFANNDDMALGAIDAYKALNIPSDQMPLIVGVDATPPALEAIEAGFLYGTVRNPGEKIAEAMLTLSLALSRNENPASLLIIDDEHCIWLPYELVSKKDIR